MGAGRLGMGVPEGCGDRAVVPSQLEEARALLSASSEIDAEADMEAAEEIEAEQTRPGMWQSLKRLAMLLLVLSFIMPLIIQLLLVLREWLIAL